MKSFRQDKLMKSDIGRGWTGEIPKIELDLSGKITNTINRHLSGLNWAMVGDYAGKDAKAAAKAIGLTDKVIPGMLQTAYLHSIDSQVKFFETLFEKTPESIPNFLIKESVEMISESFTRYMDAWIPQVKNALVYALEDVQDDLSNRNISRAHKYAHDVLKDREDMGDITNLEEKLQTRLSYSKVQKELNKVSKKFESNWGTASGTEISKASSAGAHQAILEVYGTESDDISVVFVITEDERLCQFCNHIAQSADGSYKVYKMSQIKGSGYNIGRKRGEWKASVPPMHPHCRCELVFKPKGFTVDSDGILAVED